MTTKTDDRTAIPSCRLDCLTVTLRASRAEVFSDQLDFAYQVNSYLDPTRPLRFSGRGRHFSHVFAGGGLVTAEGTPPLLDDGSVNQARNAGILAITLHGGFFQACDASERAELLLQLSSLSGFYHCTRLDGQMTLVEPECSAEQIIEDVQAGRLWVTRFKTQRVYGDRNRDGLYTNGCSQYWGGKGSDLLGRSYDKAAEQGWDTPAVRHELQLRGDRARDRFIQLVGKLKRQKATPPLLLTAESDFVKAMLKQDLDYRDTSRWAGKSKPKNWAQSAPQPGWWKAATEGAVDTLEYSRRPTSDLAQTHAAFLDQYGRKEALWMILESLRNGEDIQDAALGVFLQSVNRTKKGDAELILRDLPEGEAGQVAEYLAALQDAGARYAETGSVCRADLTGWPFEMRRSAPHG